MDMNRQELLETIMNGGETAVSGMKMSNHVGITNVSGFFHDSGKKEARLLGNVNNNDGFLTAVSLPQEIEYMSYNLTADSPCRSAGDGFESLQCCEERGNAQVEELFSNGQFCSLNEAFDEALVFLRDRLQDRYTRMRDELRLSTKNIVFQEMHKILGTAQQLRDQVLSLRELAKNQEGMIARKDHVIDNLMADFNRANEKYKSDIEECKINTEQVLERFVQRWWTKRLLQRALIAWKSYLGGTWKDRFLQRMKSEAYAECDRLRKENEANIKVYESELKLAQSEMEALRACQAEENAALKMALMRGVCALNLETLGIFNKNIAMHRPDIKPGSDPAQVPCTGDDSQDQVAAQNKDETDPYSNRYKHPDCFTPTGCIMTSANPISGKGGETWSRITSRETLAYGGDVASSKSLAYETPQCCPTRTSQVSNEEINNNHTYGILHACDEPNTNPSHLMWSVIPPRQSLANFEARYEHQNSTGMTNSVLGKQAGSSGPLGLDSSRIERLKLTTCNSTPLVKLSSHRAHQAQLLTRELSVPTGHSFTHKAHTVQLGAPAGPSTYSSSVMASIQVHRHESTPEVTVPNGTKMQTFRNHFSAPKATLGNNYLADPAGTSYIHN